MSDKNLKRMFDVLKDLEFNTDVDNETYNSIEEKLIYIYNKLEESGVI